MFGGKKSEIPHQALGKMSVCYANYMLKSEKLCIKMAEENLQIYGNFEYFLVFSKTE